MRKYLFLFSFLRGDGYKYSENISMDAIWTYPTGAEQPKEPVGLKSKGMIVVER